MTPRVFSFDPDPEPAKPRESDKFWALWEKQPLGLIFFAILVLVIAVPGLIAIMVCDFLVHPGSKGWIMAHEVVLAVSSVLALIMVTCFVLRLHIRETGFAVRGSVMETLAGYIIGMALMSVVIGILTTTGHLTVLSQNPGYRPGFALALCFFIAVLEETIFRGYMLPAFERRWGTMTALIVSSLLFGAVHLMNVRGEPHDVQLRVVLFIAVEAGLLLGGAYLVTRRLWLPIGIHWAWNFFLGPYYGAPVSGEDLFGSYRKTVLNGPAWITGGKFGPEAGIVAFAVCTIAALALLVISARSGQWRPAPGAIPVETGGADAV
ncbi:MAG TPA: type II CAAX endopeptidase family protein [Capsulimonadaceae bacterium]|jgi:hypothetical protein